MSLLVIVICLIGQECDEATSPWVVRKQMTSAECRKAAQDLVTEINERRLNPAGGYFRMECQPVSPKA